MSKNSILAVLCGVVGMTVIDLSVVNVALPSIQADLHAKPADLQLIVVAYGVLVAGFLLLGGRAGDLAGHRRVLVAGIGILAGASLIGGLSTSLAMLVAARAGQGFGAALAAPNALAIISRTFAEGPERNRALGIFGAAGGTAAIAGSVFGGLLVEGPGWQWVFFLNVPLGAALAALVLTRVPADQGAVDLYRGRRDKGRPRAGEQDGRTDLGGALALTGGLMAVSFGVHESIESGWISAPTLVPLLGGLAALGAFLAIEGRVAAPLIPLRTLRRPSLLAANIAAGLLWASFLGLIYGATLFVQQVLGYSPLAAGSSTIPIAVISLAVSAMLAPRVIDRIGPARTLAGGLAIQGVGLLLLRRAGTDASYLGDLFPAYCLVGFGLGFAQVAVQIAAFVGIEGHEAGIAGGAVETAHEMGGALGLALLVSIALAGAGSEADAFHRSLIGAAIFAGLGALVAATLLRRTETALPAGDAGTGTQPQEG
jgi:MFS family permease